MADEALKHNLDRALAPPPEFPDPLVLSRTMAALSTAVATPDRPRRPLGLQAPRVAGQWAAAAMVLVLTVTAAAVYLGLHRPVTQGQPPIGRVIFPTKMVTATTGWAVTSRGTSQQVWHTTDGGRSWIEVTPKSAVDRNPYSYTNYFLDASHAWITEIASAGQSNPYLVTFRTTDGGQTWARGTPITASFSLSLTEMFLNANLGWLAVASADLAHASWPLVYATSDGGLHWSLEASQVGAGTAPGSLAPGSAAPSFVSASTGWLAIGLYAANGSDSFYFSRTVVLVTRDGGRTWRPQSLPIALPALAVVDAPVFFGQQQGLMVVHPIDPATPVKATLLVTSNGGASWTARSLDWPYIGSIQFVDAKHGWALAGPGSDFMKSAVDQTIPLPLYRTDDGGMSWTPITTNLDLRQGRNQLTDINFVDQQTGFATIWNDGGPSQVLRSDDGGRTWSVIAHCAASVGLSYPPPPCPASG